MGSDPIGREIPLPDPFHPGLLRISGMYDDGVLFHWFGVSTEIQMAVLLPDSSFKVSLFNQTEKLWFFEQVHTQCCAQCRISDSDDIRDLRTHFLQPEKEQYSVGVFEKLQSACDLITLDTRVLHRKILGILEQTLDP
ncbi:hypothetical protein PRIPAC_85859 [Pristionchus pacificus]|uniref:Uncharacterized protein n=1 Tax=Pristionchus pacificus TaxID=54126 RepID=A0A2A6BGM4_PRIPA|nr:hypothetical protein PRIPAC_85859 [Pristionchus pacificus]|eukprot:PDM65075.1 hypothetical protein PRIPAC_53324 [Pristionchus pacificus]